MTQRGLFVNSLKSCNSSSKQTTKQNTIREIKTFHKMFILNKIISLKTRFSKKHNSVFGVYHKVDISQMKVASVVRL